MNPMAALRTHAEALVDHTHKTYMSRWGGTFNFTVPANGKITLTDDGRAICEITIEIPADMVARTIRKLAPRIPAEFTK